MAGKLGRSGRRSLTDEAERARVRQLAWTVTGQYIDSTGKLKERAGVAVQVVKSDMAKPIVVDQSQHTHFTTIQVDNLNVEELSDMAMGRKHG